MEGNNKLFIANLNWQLGEAELRQLFEQVGEVQSVHIPRDRETGRVRGFAFIEMTTPEMALQAIQRLNNTRVMDHDMVVALQDPNRKPPLRRQPAGGHRGGYGGNDYDRGYERQGRW